MASGLRKGHPCRVPQRSLFSQWHSAESFPAAGGCPLRKPGKTLGAITQGVVGNEDAGEPAFYLGVLPSNRMPSVHWEKSLKVSQWGVSSCPYCKQALLTPPPFLVMVAVAFPHHVSPSGVLMWSQWQEDCNRGFGVRQDWLQSQLFRFPPMQL